MKKITMKTFKEYLKANKTVRITSQFVNTRKDLWYEVKEQLDLVCERFDQTNASFLMLEQFDFRVVEKEQTNALIFSGGSRLDFTQINIGREFYLYEPYNEYKMSFITQLEHYDNDRTLILVYGFVR